jgi:hypothetical protein
MQHAAGLAEPSAVAIGRREQDVDPTALDQPIAAFCRSCPGKIIR